MNIVELCVRVGLCESKKEARDLIKSGGLYIVHIPDVYANWFAGTVEWCKFPIVDLTKEELFGTDPDTSS